MNTVQLAINRIKMVIPKMILEDCFIKKYQGIVVSPKTVEQSIREEVILKRVLIDLNLENGVYTPISIIGAKTELFNSIARIYYIPKENTGGRSILTAMSIGYFNSATQITQSLAQCGNSLITRAIQSLQNSIAPPAIPSNARIDVIGENTILVYNSALLPMNSYINCILENDEELSTLRPRSVPTFIELIVLATKAYIYNEMILSIDTARLVGGHDLGKYREILESYSDAEEQYQTLLTEKIGKIFYMNSKANMSSHIRLMLGAQTR